MSSPDTLVSGVAGALDELVAALQDAGVDATRNPEELQPPAAIVAVPSFIGGTMGALTVTIPVYFVSPDVGQRGVDDMLAMLALGLPVLRTREASPTLWVSPLNPQGLPSMLVTATLTIEGAP